MLSVKGGNPVFSRTMHVLQLGKDILIISEPVINQIVGISSIHIISIYHVETAIKMQMAIGFLFLMCLPKIKPPV